MGFLRERERVVQAGAGLRKPSTTTGSGRRREKPSALTLNATSVTKAMKRAGRERERARD
jgi:hypothetical protein